MQELFHVVEDAGRCSYLPGEQARFDLRGIATMSPAEYGYLLARGYRRFGWQVFRPVCASCSECRSLRVPLRDYEPRASERRILRANAGIRARLAPLFVSPNTSSFTTATRALCTGIAAGNRARRRANPGRSNSFQAQARLAGNGCFSMARNSSAWP